MNAVQSGLKQELTDGERRIAAIIDRCERGEHAAALELEREHFDSAAAARRVRVGLVPLLRAAGAYEELARALGLWLDAGARAGAGVARVSDRLLLASTYIRLGRDSEARNVLDRLAQEAPDDPSVAVAAIQFELRSGQGERAAEIAEGYERWSTVPARAAHIGMVALLRNGQPQRALDLAAACSEGMTGPLASAAAEAHLALGDPVTAARVAQRALAAGHDDAALRRQLANAAVAQFEYDRAIVHLTAAVEASPEDVRALTDLGEMLLVKKRPSAAHAYLSRALEKAPELTHVRALAARALKDMRDYAGAAQHYREIVRREPNHPHYRRQAAAIFNMAGETEQARAMFGSLIEERQRALPDSFEDGLAALWGKLDRATIPQARFDWAWSLRDPAMRMARGEWERRCRWGWLADRLLQDWLECRPERATEVMYRLADMTGGPEALEQAAQTDGGLLLASAHIGPLFAGPLALQLLDFRSVWLASTPSMPGMAYNDALISTSDHTEVQVVRRAMAALDDGASVTIAIDGAITMAAPRVPFEGQEVTYSSFGARLAHRKRGRSFFVAPRWQDEKLGFHVAELPRAGSDEPLEAFAERWRIAWFAQLRRLLAGEPENLRLAGGIWRHIRPGLAV